MAELSPMMKQYFQIKEANKDCILFYRLGDFYEMFFEDAKIASRELELVLTGRDCGQDERAPMCGVPFHSCEGYIAKLVSKGYKVAICEQVEDPKTAKGIVKREIIRVITPGTVMEQSMLDEGRNNYISCIYSVNRIIGICFCDISTGELYATEISGSDSLNNLANQLTSYSPKEILIGGDVVKIRSLPSFIKNKLSAGVELIEDEKFDLVLCDNTVKQQFGSEAEALKGKNVLVSAVGALINYLKETQMSGLERISHIDVYAESQYMKLDFNTQRNLELTQTMLTKEKRGSLLWVIDKTKTAMGKRLLRSWLEHPLMNISTINNRQSAVEELFNDTVLRLELSEQLSGILDIERLMTRVVYGSANARDLRAICTAVSVLPEIFSKISDCKSSHMRLIRKNMDLLEDIHTLIDNAIVEDPPFTVREGGMIKPGYNPELDSVSNDMNNSKDILARIENEEREKTGIPKLRVGYNKVFGYYIEVTNSYKSQVPDSYIRKQTLTNCERYITQELKDLESRILGARDRAVAMEYSIFETIRDTVADNLERIQNTAKAIAALDVLTSLANVASDHRYVRPNVNQGSIISIKESRHPVVEKVLSDSSFVPNDVYLDSKGIRAAIITGPNMAGKSTYMRQVALIVLLAQIGSFVPATSADIGIVDSIFTRVGASDDLASGQSTFMVEMSEVANIIKNATSRSLLILDEIGRGTSTFDGMSIARAVLEYCADRKKLGAKTLFATHYHELTVMERQLDGVKNYSIAVKKRGDDITFLRRIIPGGADDSYGIEVAKLAGVPSAVIKRAKEILSGLEQGKEEPKAPVKADGGESQLSLLSVPQSPVIEKLRKVDLNTLTPIEAMNLLFELKKMTD